MTGSAGQGDPPVLLSRPSDPPPRLDQLSTAPAFVVLHEVRVHRAEVRGAPRFSRVRLRAWAGKVTGRADRRLLEALGDATEAMAAFCDALADRASDAAHVTSEQAGACAQELTWLRAEVAHLRAAVASTPRGDRPPS